MAVTDAADAFVKGKIYKFKTRAVNPKGQSEYSNII
jgi:hypothetical protein